MSNKTRIAQEINNRAEGSPDDWEREEPDNPLRTSTMPAVFDTSEVRTGDTGVQTVVATVLEGDDDDESQDSSLTQDETSSDLSLIHI